MTPQQKLVLVQNAWADHIAYYTGDVASAKHIVATAELNGLFDLHKAAFAKQEREYADRDVG